MNDSSATEISLNSTEDSLALSFVIVIMGALVVIPTLGLVVLVLWNRSRSDENGPE